VDLRSDDPGELKKLEAKFLGAVRLGVEDENKKRADSKMAVKAETQLGPLWGPKREFCSC